MCEEKNGQYHFLVRRFKFLLSDADEFLIFKYSSRKKVIIAFTRFSAVVA
jgi:hypothetical protein